jgi:uncharacterized protein YndB with AHSA1/START domain
MTMASEPTGPGGGQARRPADTARFEYPEGEPIIRITREFDAPRELVWKAMSERELVGRWWGPRGYEVIVEEFDMRVGGKWAIRHRGSDGEHLFFGDYIEIVPPEKLVQTFGYLDWPPSTETMVLTDLGQRTRLEVVSVFDSVESRDGMAQSGMEGGARETYERLDAVLEDLVG